MPVILNKIPTLKYNHKDKDIDNLKHGSYAFPLCGSRANSELSFGVFIFKDVAEHVDGNGLKVFWLLEGEGVFYVEGNGVSLKSGDVLIFNDKQKHSFKSARVTKAASIEINENILSLEENQLKKKILDLLSTMENKLNDEKEVWL